MISVHWLENYVIGFMQCVHIINLISAPMNYLTLAPKSESKLFRNFLSNRSLMP